jgi:hypothetical protein
MRRPAALVLGLLLSSALTGCIALPDDGPVHESSTTGSGNRADAMTVDPLGPQPGQSPSEVVKGFLDAMQATPIDDTVARQFLTDASAELWDPARTVVYDDISLPRLSPESGKLVDVTLTGADEIDGRGTWQGALDDRAETDLRFAVIEEDGESRIAGPPNQLIVPRIWYAQRFRQVSLYFFNPTSQVLVPDPVFVPRGVDLASILVQRLIAGPDPDLLGNSRNLLPGGADPDLTVPVSADGVATVDLGDVPVPSLADRGLLVAQLAWTLRQDTSVDRLQVLVDGTPMTLPGEGDNVSITTGEVFAPYVADANKLLFGLKDDRMVAGGAGNLAAVSGPFGQAGLGLRSITPSLDASQAAGITGDGSTLYLGDVRATEGVPQAAVPVVSGATDLLVPAWDFSGRLWMVDRTTDGAVVSYLRDSEPQRVDVPGVSGADVKTFLVSRDGSRFVAVVRRPGSKEDAVVVSRILQTPQGEVEETLPARQVDVEEGRGLRIRDIAWVTPTSIVALHPIGDELFQVRTASVDGAPGGGDDLSVTLDGEIVGLLGTPDPRQSTYAIDLSEGEGTLVDLSGPTGSDLVFDPAITSLGYVG